MTALELEAAEEPSPVRLRHAGAVVDHRQAQAAAGLLSRDLDLHLAVTAVLHGVVQQGPQDLVGLVEFGSREPSC